MSSNNATSSSNVAANDTTVAPLQRVLDSIARIQRLAEAAAQEDASLVATIAVLQRHCQCLAGTLLTLQQSSHYAGRFHEPIQHLQTTLDQAESCCNHKVQPWKDLSVLLNEDAINLCLCLNVELPMEHDDDNDERDRRAPFVPPMLHQMVVDIPPIATPRPIHRDGDETDSTASLSQEYLTSDSDDEYDDPHYMPWDFTRVPTATNLWGVAASSTSSQSSYASPRDRQLYYARIQALRALDPNTRITQIRVCLANLEQGDTTPAVQMGRAMVTALVAPAYGFTAGLAFGIRALTTGHNYLGNPTQGVLQDATFGASAAFQFIKHTFLHFMLEFQLENSMTCTMERCVDDVHLYEGQSSRANKKCVFYVNTGTTSTNGASLPVVRLRDLIQFRNEKRHCPYGINNGNNCKEFVWEFLLRTLQMKAPPNYSFSSSCQTIYGCHWPPSDLVETLAILQSTASTVPTVQDEHHHDRYTDGVVSKGTGIMSLLQRKRVNLWASGFGEHGKCE
jgi:hypothetical protein